MYHYINVSDFYTFLNVFNSKMIIYQFKNPKKKNENRDLYFHRRLFWKKDYLAQIYFSMFLI